MSCSDACLRRDGAQREESDIGEDIVDFHKSRGASWSSVDRSPRPYPLAGDADLRRPMSCIVQLSVVQLLQRKSLQRDKHRRDHQTHGGGRPCSSEAHNGPPSRNYLLTHVNPFLALTRPCFFLSTLLGSRVTQPAENNKLARSSSCRWRFEECCYSPLRSAGFSAGS